MEGIFGRSIGNFPLLAFDLEPLLSTQRSLDRFKFVYGQFQSHLIKIIPLSANSGQSVKVSRAFPGAGWGGMGSSKQGQQVRIA